MSGPPECVYCRTPLNRIDHYAIEHTILDDGVYRPVGINDGAPQSYGLASEIQLRCTHCDAEIAAEQRQYFYERWTAVLEFINKQMNTREDHNS